MKLMPLSIALLTIRIDSCTVWGLPICEPPSPTHDTFSPVCPSVRRGISPDCPFTLPATVRPAATVPRTCLLSFTPVWTLSGDDVFHNLASNACQPRVKTLPLNRKTFVIDTQQVEHGRVEVGNGDRVLLRGVTEIVS